jgi:signal transduction histidine kinase
MLHVPTLALVAGLLNLFQAVAFGVVWRFNRQIPGIGLWFVSAVLNGVALVLYVLGAGGSFGLGWDTPFFHALPFNIHSDIFTKLLPTTMAIGCGMFFYFGAAFFFGRRPMIKWPLLVALPLLLGFYWFVVVDSNQAMRALFSQPIFILFYSLGAREFFLSSKPGLRFSTLFLGSAAGLCCMAFLYRFCTVPFLASPAAIMDSVLPHIITFAMSIFWALVWTFGSLALINQRQLLETQEANTALLRARDEAADLERDLLAERAHRQRQHLIRDLHDGVGGVTANLALLASLGQVEEINSEQKALLSHIEQLAIEGNYELRSLMNSLEKDATHWADFLRDFRGLAEKQLAARDIALDWRVCGQSPSTPLFDVPAGLSLLRALKEAVANLSRHAAARHAGIRFAFHTTWLGVTIRDDGCGISSTTPAAGGRGLGNMRRRLEELNGRLSIRSSHGTVLRFVVPLPLTLSAKSDSDLVSAADSSHFTR